MNGTPSGCSAVGSAPALGKKHERVQQTKQRVFFGAAVKNASDSSRSSFGNRKRANKATSAKTEYYRGVAQLVARLLWEQDAAGSNPVTPTIKIPQRYVDIAEGFLFGMGEMIRKHAVNHMKMFQPA